MIGGGRMREPIAILGMALRLPGGVSTPEQFWTALAEGRDLVGTIPAERWDAASFLGADPDEAGTIYDDHGGFLENVDAFDAGFFGLSPREASQSDPQQRLLLELTWEALERSGINAQSLARTQTGIWMGISNSDWARMLGENPQKIDGYTGTGAARSVIAGRIAHFLGTYGPAEVIDTACSSSLVAIHRAVQSLRLGESNLAVVGGANLILSPELHICFARAGMLSRTGKCRTFDKAADGYVRAEACGVVVLKRLSDACCDGDPVLAVIRGSAVNQDGRSTRLTVPNIRAQQKVMRAALADAELEPGAVSYVEAHGTGTPVGDPMEFLSIGRVYGSGRAAENRLRVGSVKTNLGHAEGAAGLVGLMKAVLMLQPGHAIAPHLHCSSPSHRIDWDRWPIEVPHASTPWPALEAVHFAGVSSFGFSGTNAHVIVASPEISAGTGPIAKREESSEELLCISAADPQALLALAASYVVFLRETGESFTDICRGALITRAWLTHRLVLKANDTAAAAASLERWLAGDEDVNLVTDAASARERFAGGGSLLSLAVDFLTGEKLRISSAGARRVSLPLYPFQRQRFWFGDAPEVQSRCDRERVWGDVCREAERQSRQGPLGWKPESYPRRWKALERLTLAYAQNVLFQAGAFADSNPVTVEDVMQKCGFQAMYSRLVARWLRGLARERVLVDSDGCYRSSSEWGPVALKNNWHEVESALDGDPNALAYFRRCGDLLSDILTGRISPLETLFPAGSFDFAEAMYQQALEARYSNAIVAEAVCTAIQDWGQKRNVRVLEVGAGTGGTTSAVLPLLPDDRTEYWFSDVSELFLRRARQKFRQHPFVRYALFDVDREPEEQSLPTGRFDMVVAANVLHAARDLRASLGWIRRLLVPGGLLLLIETTVHQACFDMSIGLIDGWQHFEDKDRVEHPLLDAERWCEVLTESGFEQTMALPAKDSPAFLVGQHVVLAQRDFHSLRESSELAGKQQEELRKSKELSRNAETMAAAELHELSGPERTEAVRGIVCQTICRVFQLEMPWQEIGERDRLSDLGMDSLIALELRSELAKALGLEGRISATVAFDTGTVGELTNLLLGLLEPMEETAFSESALRKRGSGTAVRFSVEALQEMTDAEVEQLLKERLAER